MAIAVCGSRTENCHRRATHSCEQEKTVDRTDGKQYGTGSSGEANMREGVRSKRGSTTHYEVANYASNDSDHCAGFDSMLHALATQDRLAVHAPSDAAGHLLHHHGPRQ